MSALSTEKSRPPKSPARANKAALVSAPRRAPKIVPSIVAKTPKATGDEPERRTTKQERVLTLLSHPEGASIEEMMQATDWQQHSVRGFLAGTVKKKLGFSLTSLKPNGRRSPLPHRNAARSLT